MVGTLRVLPHRKIALLFALHQGDSEACGARDVGRCKGKQSTQPLWQGSESFETGVWQPASPCAIPG